MRKFGICTPLITLCGYIFATNVSTDNRKNMLNSNMYSTRHHNMVNFGHLMAEISWRVWGTLTNFNRFCVLASLLHQRRSVQVNQTLHDVWRSPVLVHYIYIFRGSCPLTEFCRCKIHFASKSTARHLSSRCEPNFAEWDKEIWQ